MGIRFHRLIGVAALVAASASFGSAAMANPYLSSPETVPVSPRTLGIDRTFVPVSPRPFGLEELYNDVFFENDREFYNNRSILRQLDFLLGWRNSFVENEINRDAKNIHELYVETLNQQVASDPVLRTPDLPNPYGTSLLQLPSFNVNRPLAGSEFNYQELPPR